MSNEELNRQFDIVHKENQQYMKIFEDYMIKEGLTKRTMRKHMYNIDMFLECYMTYEMPYHMREGCYSVNAYFDGFITKKTSYSTMEDVKSIIATLNKFYKLMYELRYITVEDYMEYLKTVKYHKYDWEMAMYKAKIKPYLKGDWWV